MSERPRRRRTRGILEGKGYYIVLFLCVAAIGISGYFLMHGLTAAQPTGGFGKEDSAAVSGRAELEKQREAIHQRDQALAEAAQENGSAAEPASDTPSTEETAAEPAPAEEPEPAAPDEEAASAAAYVWPVEGAVDRDFSLEVFAYDDTMGDWRTHDGLDIEAEPGTSVGACATGTVETVATDDMLGVMVTVDHGGGLRSVYANLADPAQVQEGDPVEAGTVIGTVGATAISESAGPSHLHFSMSEYGVSVDPLNYLH